MCALKQQRKMSQSKPGLLWRSLDLPTQQLSSLRHFVRSSNSVLWSCQHRAEIAATYVLGKSCWEGWAVVWDLAQPASDISSLRLPSKGGSWLWLEHCVFWLTQLADKSPGTPGSANQSGLRLHSYIQESLGQRHRVQQRAQPSLPP